MKILKSLTHKNSKKYSLSNGFLWFLHKEKIVPRHWLKYIYYRKIKEFEQSLIYPWKFRVIFCNELIFFKHFPILLNPSSLICLQLFSINKRNFFKIIFTMQNLNVSLGDWPVHLSLYLYLAALHQIFLNT